MHSSTGPDDKPSMGPGSDPLISDFAEDEDIIDLVEEFVETLPCRVEAVQDALRGQNLELLITLAHQMKGAGGGYGFTPITDAARDLEMAARSELGTDTLNALVEELASLCHRAKARG